MSYSVACRAFEGDALKIQSLFYFQVSPSNLNMVWKTPPIGLLNENPRYSLFFFSKTPWVNVDKSSNGVAYLKEDLLGPHLQGKVWEFYPYQVI